MLKKQAYTMISGIIALIFTVFIALDTFVISHVYTVIETQPVEKQINEIQPAETQTDLIQSVEKKTEGIQETETQLTNTEEKTETIITDKVYLDENIQIELLTFREYETDIYVADIVLSSSQYLKTALAKNTYGKNVTDTTSNIAEDNGAILAVNGDYFGVQERGYVIRNGVLYRDISKGNQEDLLIFQDGKMEIINEKDVSAEDLVRAGVNDLLCFGPGLIKNGEISVTKSDEVARAMTSNPRTAIGMIDELHYVFVVTDGRTTKSEGLSLYELAQFMKNLDVKMAYNLDGGGSSTLYFNGRVVNNPTSGSYGKKNKNSFDSEKKERSVSDIVYIGY